MAVSEGASPKSAPDVGKLQSMQRPVVIVTKGRKGAGRAILTGQKGLKVDDILALHTSVPINYGPGVYKFEVTDEAGDGSGKDVWTVQLGADISDPVVAVPAANEFEMPMPAMGSMNFPGVPPMSVVSTAAPQSTHPVNAINGAANAAAMGGAAPGGVPEGSRQIGPGWWYNEMLGVLVSRNGDLFQWRPGQPLPGAAPVAAAASPIAPPWGMPPGAPMPPWGPNYPVTPSQDDERFKMLEKQLAEAREERKELERRNEIEALRLSMEKAVEAQNANIAKLIESLSTRKPEGPTEAERALTARLEAQERMIEESRRREEARRDEEARRSEFNAVIERLESQIKAAQADKADPMLPIFMQMLNSSQTQATAMVQSIQQAATMSAEAAREGSRLLMERMGSSQMTPEKVMELLRVAKDRGPEAEVNKGLIGMFKETFGMAQEVVRMQAEAYRGEQSPAWVGIAQQALERVGGVAQMVAANRASVDAKTEREAQMQRRREMEAHQERMAHATRAQVAQAQRPAAVAPVAAHSAVAPVAAKSQSEMLRDAAAAQQFPAGAKRGGAAERDAIAKSLGMDTRAQDAGVVPIRGEVVTADDDDEDEDDLDLPAAGSGNRNLPTVDVSKVSADEVRRTVARLSDADFFGLAWQHVETLREGIMNDEIDVETATVTIGQAVQQLQAFGSIPPAVELLFSGHVGIAIERLIPDASAKYRTALVASVQEALTAAAEAS